MIKKPELLVPAGGMEQLKAAVASGADAVYLGGTFFSARAHAVNFSEQDLREAIDYAHRYGVSVHVALNTLLTEEELPQALMFASHVYRFGADAVIVQDQGLFEQIHRFLPELSLHLSTQGTVIDCGGVQQAAHQGASRVILARELSLSEIREICRNKGDTEIEIFVHGAICIGLSGQCHLSGSMGNRSGNRGDCAQPCRLKYVLSDKEENACCSGYHLSPKDLCLLGHLKEITEAGVDSIKIEGRLKSPEYAAAVTGIYRKHLDRIGTEEESRNRKELEADLAVLRQVYSRGSFTDAYLRGSAGQELMSGFSPKHQGIWIGKMSSFQKRNGHALVELSGELSVGDGVEITGKHGRADNVVTYIRDGRNGLLKKAKGGTTVEIGDLRLQKGLPEKGASVYRIRSRELSRTLQQQCREIPQRIPVDFFLSAETGKRLCLEGITANGTQSCRAAAESKEVLESIRSGSIDRERLKVRLLKTGGTPYFCRSADLKIEGNPFIPVSMMNELRRQVLSDLTEQRMAAGRPSEKKADEAEERCRKGTEDSQNVRMKQGKGEDCLVQLYFYESESAEKWIRNFLLSEREQGTNHLKLVFCLPLAFFLNEKKERSLLQMIEDAGYVYDVVFPLELNRTALSEEAESVLQSVRLRKGFRAVMISSAGQRSMAEHSGCPFETDLPLNILNSASASFWLKEGARSVCVSEEPDFLQSVSEDSFHPQWCVPVYGRVPVMYLEHCPIGSHRARYWERNIKGMKTGNDGKKDGCCSQRKKQYYCRQSEWYLQDQRGGRFPVKGDSECCRAIVFSQEYNDRTHLFHRLKQKGTSMFRISILEESSEEIRRILLRLDRV